MKTFAVVLMVFVSGSFAFGLPDTPDVPDADIPDIEIPGLDILDGIQVQLDELIASTDSLVWLIPELSALDDVSAKLEELRDTDPDVIGLQEQIDSLRGELLVARSEIEEISDAITGDVEEVRSSLDTFIDGLPIPTD
ncbi:MAG: hypothetical protein K8S15_01855 [Candidatus Aegiribacteria sp.]|nr:hypothetical protein [Candidatus Aegiribacteria sp.]